MKSLCNYQWSDPYWYYQLLFCILILGRVFNNRYSILTVREKHLLTVQLQIRPHLVIQIYPIFWHCAMEIKNPSSHVRIISIMIKIKSFDRQRQISRRNDVTSAVASVQTVYIHLLQICCCCSGHLVTGHPATPRCAADNCHPDVTIHQC